MKLVEYRLEMSELCREVSKWSHEVGELVL